MLFISFDASFKVLLGLKLKVTIWVLIQQNPISKLHQLVSHPIKKLSHINLLFKPLIFIETIFFVIFSIRYIFIKQFPKPDHEITLLPINSVKCSRIPKCYSYPWLESYVKLKFPSKYHGVLKWIDSFNIPKFLKCRTSPNVIQRHYLI